MQLKPIMQCERGLDFRPQSAWPDVLPALAWRGHLLCGFKRTSGEALDLGESPLVEVMKAAHPDLALGELARFLHALNEALPDSAQEFREPVLTAYGLRASDRLEQTMRALRETPRAFQEWADDKRLGARDLAALLALDPATAVGFDPFLRALVSLGVSKSEGVRALELGVELYLLGRPLNDLLPSTDRPDLYLKRLEQWRRPQSHASDETWRQDVALWPWPSRVVGQWQRFGDEAGLEIKIRTTSPQDFLKQLERLQSIRETWSCKT